MCNLFISVINQLDAQNFCFTIRVFQASTCFLHCCAHHQKVKIELHNLWYHHTYRCPSRAQIERESSLNLCMRWLSSPIRTTCPAHLILLDFIARTILGAEYKSFSSSLCSLLHYPITSSLLGPNILLNIVFSNTLSFLSSRNVSDQVSHPYKTTGKIIVLYILIFKFLVSNLDAILCGIYN